MQRARCLAFASLVAATLAFSRPAHGQTNEPESEKTSRPGWVPQIREDFKNLMAPENIAILRLGLGGSLLSSPLDRELTRSASQSESLGSLFGAGSTLGDGALHGSAALATYALGRLKHKPRLERLGRDLIRAQVINDVLTGGLKLAADRTRPDGRSFSFPSGHTSVAFTSATLLQKHLGWKVGVPAFAAAAYVGGSRIADNHHYLSDVLFGAALGIVAGRTVTVGRDRKRFSMTPQWVRGGFGITFELPPPTWR